MGKLTTEALAELVFSQFKTLQLRYPTFQLSMASDGGYLLDGQLSFGTQVDGKPVQGQYQIAVAVPASYPATPPTAKETSAKIPDSFHKFTDSQELCLAAPVEVVRVFRGDPTLNGYVSNLVLPFLINFQYREQHGTLPFGELAHGYEGILAYYQTRFGTEIEPTLRLLKILADKNIERQVECHCGSGISIRDCHYGNLKELSKCLKPCEFGIELVGILSWCLQQDHIKVISAFMPATDRRRRRRKLEKLIGRRK
ncbi:hypothetical protein Pla52n_47330 [Stieleria varia]|uniref:Uncharacterized protein n=1 Tax=Stieleria varia TaxID=2528005 RepID=A0A5C6AJ13_9BACT|nr:hypothetical protein Pla52n_47330 [Stieleria varia]